MTDIPGRQVQAVARPAGAIRADIEQERTALSGAFDTLRDDLGEAVDAGRSRARQAGRKAAVIAPIVAAVGLAAVGAALLSRRR